MKSLSVGKTLPKTAGMAPPQFVLVSFFYSCKLFFSANTTRLVYNSIIICFAGIKCATPDGPVNGAVSSMTERSDDMGNIPYGTEVTFYCDIGYGLVGSKTITCHNDGRNVDGVLDPIPPTCQRKSY